jgi:hypothetical protein
MGNEQVPRLHWPVMKKSLPYLLLAFVLMVLVWPVHILVIEDARSGTVVWCRLIQPRDRFTLMYRHSVELCHVWDHFKIDGKCGLVLDETIFPSSNTGLPAVLGDGERLARGEKGFHISNMRRTLPAVEIWVDRRYDNTLTFGEQKVSLPELAGNTLLRLQTRNASFAEFVYHKLHSFFISLAKRMR